MISSANTTEAIFNDAVPFRTRAWQAASFQLQYVSEYRMFADLTGYELPGSESSLEITRLPFLPVEFFRSHRIIAQGCTAAVEFSSSGTTGTASSVHVVADPALYDRSIELGFRSFYGSPEEHVIFALLPSYLEQGRSSLVYMFERLSAISGSEAGGFYRYDHDRLIDDLTAYRGSRRKLLIGVSFALWEMAEQYPGTDLSGTIVMETGGMKGRRREIIREELHGILQEAFHLPSVHSEYGMTELLSQAWSSGGGIFRCPPWMKVLVRDPYDPVCVSESGKGILNVIDLANRYSCSFIATQDLGEVYEDGTFKVMGRVDNSALRGCNLMF